jgi:PEGA domain
LRTLAALFLMMLAGHTALVAEKARDTITITTTPPGATVEWNRKIVGVTPLTFKVGEYAFNARKSSS